MTGLFIALSMMAGAFAAPLPAARPAPAAAPVAPAAARIAIPFSPPLGRPLRYRVTRQGEAGDATIYFVYELIFSARPGGFRMAVRAVDIGSSALPPASRRRFRAMMTEIMPPYVALLAPDGALEGLVDEEAYWRRLLAVSERWLRRLDRDMADSALVGQIMAMVRDMPIEARRAELLKYMAPLLEFAATDQALGEERVSEVEASGILGVPIRQRYTVRPERVAEGHLFVAAHGIVPPEEIARALEAMMPRIPVTGEGANTRAGRDRMMEQIRGSRIERRSDMTYEVALDSGLTRRYRVVNRTSVTMSGQTRTQNETFTIAREN